MPQTQQVFDTAITSSTPRPLVIWHGLGDTALSDGISDFVNRVKQKYDGIYIHSARIPPDGTPDDERKAGFWGNAEEQGDQGCEQIKAIPELSDGFDAIGFSQGGLFLRHYAQFCDGPPVKNLITFGTPHYGIAALIPCPTPPTLSCLLAARAARGGIYTAWAQSHIIQAAYFRDTDRLDEFYGVNTFVRDLNGEGPAGVHRSESARPRPKEGGGRGLGGLENMVAIAFDDDRTVSPALSAHWSAYEPDNKTVTVPLNESALYAADWIGLRALHERGRLWLESCPGEHMELGGEGGCADRMVDRWVGVR
ncbi:hypothetical protein Q5752_003342 [Cryptotrichosporon argae]